MRWSPSFEGLFSVVGKDPDTVTTRDVLSFVTAQRRGRRGVENVVRIADGGAGLSAATTKHAGPWSKRWSWAGSGAARCSGCVSVT